MLHVESASVMAIGSTSVPNRSEFSKPASMVRRAGTRDPVHDVLDRTLLVGHVKRLRQ